MRNLKMPALLLFALVFVLALAGCRDKPDDIGEAALYDKIPMVMVAGKLYYDTGRESTVTGRCGVMDGEITSTVDGNQTPSEDNQSNFGTGYGYQFWSENSLEIFINDKWIVFEQRDSSSGEALA